MEVAAVRVDGISHPAHTQSAVEARPLGDSTVLELIQYLASAVTAGHEVGMEQL